MEDIIEKIKNKVGLNCVFDFICSMTASNIWNINWVNNLENWKNVDKLLKKYKPNPNYDLNDETIIKILDHLLGKSYNNKIMNIFRYMLLNDKQCVICTNNNSSKILLCAKCVENNVLMSKNYCEKLYLLKCKDFNRLRTIQIYKQKNYNQYMSRTSYYLISDIETLSLKKHGSEKHHLIMQNLNLRKQKIKDKFDKQNMRIKEYIDYVYSNDFPLLNDIINNEMLIHNKNLIIGTGKFFPVRDINTIKKNMTCYYVTGIRLIHKFTNEQIIDAYASYMFLMYLNDQNINLYYLFKYYYEYLNNFNISTKKSLSYYEKFKNNIYDNIINHYIPLYSKDQKLPLFIEYLVHKKLINQ